MLLFAHFCFASLTCSGEMQLGQRHCPSVGPKQAMNLKHKRVAKEAQAHHGTVYPGTLAIGSSGKISQIAG